LVAGKNIKTIHDDGTFRKWRRDKKDPARWLAIGVGFCVLRKELLIT